ncbi:MAG: nucleotidyltransferase domain-containing protein [bacterium]
MIASNKTIEKAVEFIKEKIAPEKIYLFGSYANGSQTEKSDLDFFIIKTTNIPKYKRSMPLYSMDKTRKIGIPIGIDFIVYTPQEFENNKNEKNSLAGEVLRSGKLLYAK